MPRATAISGSSPSCGARLTRGAGLFRAGGFDSLVPRHIRGEPGMAIIVGTGDFKYRIVEDWAKLPDGWSFKEVGAVGVDGNDNVYVFNRGDHPIMVFDRGGNFLRSW